jgi:hypothetical protein
MIATAILLLLAAEPAAAPAAAEPLPVGMVRLSEAQIAAIEAEARKKDELGLGEGRGLQVHGEVGVEIGTGGYRALDGIVGVPLGQDGYASFSFATGRYPRNYRGARRR